jgi:hypothetical protein
VIILSGRNEPKKKRLAWNFTNELDNPDEIIEKADVGAIVGERLGRRLGILVGFRVVEG